MVRFNLLRNTCRTFTFLLLILPIEIFAKTKICWTTEIWPKVAEQGDRGAYFDLLNAIYPSPEFELEHVFLPYMRGIHLMREERMDLFSICSPMNDVYRAKHPWAQEHLGVLFDSKTMTNWQGVSSLVNKNIALHKEIAVLPFIGTLEANLIKTQTKAKSLLLLELGRADFVLGIDINIQEEVAKNNNISMDDYTFVPLHTVTCYPGFAASPKGERLRGIWDKGIQRLSKSGELQAIYTKWKLQYPSFK